MLRSEMMKCHGTWIPVKDHDAPRTGEWFISFDTAQADTLSIARYNKDLNRFEDMDTGIIVTPTFWMPLIPPNADWWQARYVDSEVNVPSEQYGDLDLDLADALIAASDAINKLKGDNCHEDG